MKIRINDKKISELKVISILYVVLSVVRKIIVIPLAIIYNVKMYGKLRGIKNLIK